LTSDSLPQSALFDGLDDEALRAVQEAALVRHVKDGAFFFHQGDPARVLYVLAEGRVKFTQVTPDGQQVLLRAILPGETFGAVAALGDAYHPASGQAVGACAALGWESDTIGDLMTRYPRLALNALRFLAGRLEEFQDRYREMSTERVERRVAHALLRLAYQVGRPTEGGVLIDMALTRQDIAELTGTTLYTASRILSAWEAHGLVASGRSRLLIRDLPRLRAIAEGDPPPAG
jgi:CRP-like cAMP-binding protein